MAHGASLRRLMRHVKHTGPMTTAPAPPDPGLLPPPEARALLDSGAALLTGLASLGAVRAAAVVRIQQSYTALQAAGRDAALARLPVSALQPLVARLPEDALIAARLGSVRDVLSATPAQLDAVPGIGQATARQIRAAAAQVADAMAQTQRIRLSRETATPDSSALVAGLHQLRGLDALTSAAQTSAAPTTSAPTTAFAADVQRAMSGASLAGARLKWFLSSTAAKTAAIAALGALAQLLHSPLGVALGPLAAPREQDIAAAWADFETAAAEFYATLALLVPMPAEVAAAQGFLPADIVEQVDKQELDGSLMTVTLRGYQVFGAKFALVQRRVIIGDEMGLGKTMQALAAMAHLRSSQAQTHFLVVCPASVLINWMREIATRTKLEAHREHGDGRDAALAQWQSGGGVAVVTYDSLQAIVVPPDVEVGMLVVDEAHYIKNPETARSKAMRVWTTRVQRVLFLTGTPMENRIEEFRVLIAYLQPQLVTMVGDQYAVAGGDAFAQAVAPVYLRRNQVDVLAELPELVQSDDWVEFTAADQAGYRDAVLAGNFMAMRQVAYAAPADDSAKIQRILDVLEDAAQNGLKVLVFSFFLGVLDRVTAVVAPGPTFGPITGATPPDARQQIVDAFSAHEGHAVLLGQIQASGVGLNIQAASVIILCEPQVKPTTEAQAVGRAHRMGQVRTVLVHRILAEDTVDERMLEILTGKQQLFDTYVRRSEIAEASPEATDPNDVGLATRVVQLEQARLAGPQSTDPQSTGTGPPNPPA
jgi:superfamily II DNA or RNA helicase